MGGVVAVRGSPRLAGPGSVMVDAIAQRGRMPTNKSVGNTIVGNPTPPYGQDGRVIPRFSLSVVPSYSVR